MPYCLHKIQLNLPFLYLPRKNLLLSKKLHEEEFSFLSCVPISTVSVYFSTSEYVTNNLALWCCHLQWCGLNPCLLWYDPILLIAKFDSLGMADNDLFLTIAVTCEAQRKVMAHITAYASQHCATAVIWMIFWKKNELARYHSLDAICCSHHKYQLVRSKTHDLSLHLKLPLPSEAFCIWSRDLAKG